MNDRRELLWTDDEGPGRFQYAAHRLAKEGWSIQWARSVEEAAAALRERPFDALVLDQMLPLRHDTDAATVWGGATLLRWLRGAPVASGAPAEVHAPPGEPRAANAAIPVAVVSAYRHDDVEHAIFEAGGPTQYVGKPLNLDAVRRAIAPSEPGGRR